MGRQADRALVRRVLAGDLVARRNLADRMKCIRRIVSLQNRKIGSSAVAEDVEDVAQEAVLAVYRKLSVYDGSASLEAWMGGFAVRELLRFLRRKRYAPRILEQELEGSALEPVAPDRPSLLDFERVLEGLEALPPEDARVVRLKSMGDLTFEAVGKELGISPNTAKTRYYRAMGRLRTLLGSKFEGVGEVPR